MTSPGGAAPERAGREAAEPTLHWPTMGCPDTHHVCVDTEFSRAWDSCPMPAPAADPDAAVTP